MAVNVNVIGRLGRDAEIVKNERGDFLSFSLATDEFKRGNKTTTWLSVVLHDVKLAEWLKKGRMVNIIGTETINTYTDKNGTLQISRNVSADKVEFISVGSGATQNNTSDTEGNADVAATITTGVLSKPSTVQATAKTANVNTAAIDNANDDDLPF